MITINLLPEELRVTVKKTGGSGKNQVVRIVILLVAIFVLITLFFYVNFLTVSAKYSSVDKEWDKKRPEYKALTQLRDDIDGELKTEKDFMENFVTTHQPLTYILQWASEFLPENAWLSEVNMLREQGVGKLVVRGSAFSSKEKSSIAVIEEYLQHLKNNLPQGTLSLTTTRIEIGAIPITQFNATYTWKDKQVYEQIAQ